MTLDELQYYLPGRMVMLVPGIFKLCRVSIMLQIWHIDFMNFLPPVMVGVVEILVLTSICLRLGGCLCTQRVVPLNKCLVAGMLLLRFHSFITALLVGSMIGWYVCSSGRLIVDVFCFCDETSGSGLFVTLFHYFVITLIR